MSTYNLRNHIVTLTPGYGTYDLVVSAKLAGTYENVYIAEGLVITGDDFSFDLLPVMTALRVDENYTIFEFTVEMVYGDPEVVAASVVGDWVFGYRIPDSFDCCNVVGDEPNVSPIRYPSWPRFSPLYPVHITGKDFTVTVDGSEFSRHSTFVWTMDYNPQSSFALNGVSFEKACGDVQISFLNSLGAFVDYIPGGNCYKNDTYERYTYRPSKYVESGYKTRTTERYVVNTELLNDAYSKVIAEDLMRSPYIVLYHPDFPSGAQVHLVDGGVEYRNPLRDENSGMWYELTFVVDSVLTNA